MMLRTALVAALITCLFACAPKNFEEPGVLKTKKKSTSQTFDDSYSSIWQATLAAIDVKKYPIAIQNRKNGRIVTDWVRGKSDRLYSGYGESRIPYTIRFKLMIQLRPSRKGVNITVANQEEYYTDSITAGTDFSGSLYQWIPTKSSTVKENALLREISSQLQKNESQK